MTETFCFITDVHVFNHAVGTRTYNLAKEIKKQTSNENKIFLISVNDNFSFSKFTKNGIDIFQLPHVEHKYLSKILYFIFSFYVQLRLFFKVKIDYIFAVGPYSITLGSFAHSLNSSSTLIYDVPGISKIERLVRYGKVNNLHTFLIDNLHKVGLRSSNLISTINKAHRHILSKNTKKNIVIVRDAAYRDKYFLKDSKDSLRHNFNIPLNEIVILFVGSLELDKLNDLINASKSLIDESFKVKFIIVGKGSKSINFEKLVEENNLTSKFKFTGFLSEQDLIRYMNMADIAYSDYWSLVGFPRKIFEYMAAALPIIVKNSKPIREVLEDGRESMLYNDNTEFNLKLRKLVIDSNLRGLLSSNSRRLSKDYTWSTSSKALLKAIDI